MASKMKKKTIVLSCIAALVLAVGIFLLIWYCGARYPEFDEIVREEAAIPGLSDGIAPQGLCMLPENEQGYQFGMSGYMPDGVPSRLYLIAEGKSKYVTLTDDGQPLTTHFGGVACSGSYLLIASGNEVVRVSLSRVLEAEAGAAVEIVDSLTTDMENAYCYYEDGLLYVGEFYRAGNYETAETHRIAVDGEQNYGLIYVYEADESRPGGVKSGTPVKALSVRGLVQGIAVTQDRIYLSTSYGLPNSTLYVYDNILQEESELSVTVNGTAVPVCFLSGDALRGTLTMPCMSEEICLSGDRLYILFESMANKYKMFVRTRVRKIVSLPVSELG